MKTPEVFYLHIQGEQRGPYTVPQIDHLLNSGLIGEETLFWREGLEQWQPVTDLVAKRTKKRPWAAIGIGILVCFAVAMLLHLFGPITLVGWREANQHEFSETAAYWRARDIVRNHALPKGTLVQFARFRESKIALLDGTGANVELHGTLSEANGSSRQVSWRVDLRYDPRFREWSGIHAAETTEP